MHVADRLVVQMALASTCESGSHIQVLWLLNNGRIPCDLRGNDSYFHDSAECFQVADSDFHVPG